MLILPLLPDTLLNQLMTRVLFIYRYRSSEVCLVTANTFSLVVLLEKSLTDAIVAFFLHDFLVYKVRLSTPRPNSHTPFDQDYYMQTDRHCFVKHRFY